MLQELQKALYMRTMQWFDNVSMVQREQKNVDAAKQVKAFFPVVNFTANVISQSVGVQE